MDISCQQSASNPTAPGATWIEQVHSGYVAGRRVRVLAHHLAPRLPRGLIADVGCGDGQLTALLQQARPDCRFIGLDVLVRPHPQIRMLAYDGQRLPLASASVDGVLLVDVLHHAQDPMKLLREAGRVARQSVVIKDHTRNGLLAGPTLRFMDRVGNRRYGVSLPYNYWTADQWQRAFGELGWQVQQRQAKLGLYPFPASLVFERGLHFVARLNVHPGPAVVHEQV